MHRLYPIGRMQSLRDKDSGPDRANPKHGATKTATSSHSSYTYTIDYICDESTGRLATYKVTTDERMVMRDRQNKFEEFSYTVQ